jgi:hypothetical protein
MAKFFMDLSREHLEIREYHEHKTSTYSGFINIRQGADDCFKKEYEAQEGCILRVKGQNSADMR